MPYIPSTPALPTTPTPVHVHKWLIESWDLSSGDVVQPECGYDRANAAAKYLTRTFDIPEYIATDLINGSVQHGVTTFQFTSYAGTRLEYQELVAIMCTQCEPDAMYVNDVLRHVHDLLEVRS